MTVCGYTTMVCHQPPRPAQRPTLSGMGNEYRPSGSDTDSAVQLEDNCNTGIASQSLWYMGSVAYDVIGVVKTINAEWIKVAVNLT